MSLSSRDSRMCVDVIYDLEGDALFSLMSSLPLCSPPGVNLFYSPLYTTHTSSCIPLAIHSDGIDIKLDVEMRCISKIYNIINCF
jgi:hypothetical protein